MFVCICIDIHTISHHNIHKPQQPPVPLLFFTHPSNAKLGKGLPHHSSAAASPRGHYRCSVGLVQRGAPGRGEGQHCHADAWAARALPVFLGCRKKKRLKKWRIVNFGLNRSMYPYSESTVILTCISESARIKTHFWMCKNQGTCNSNTCFHAFSQSRVSHQMSHYLFLPVL